MKFYKKSPYSGKTVYVEIKPEDIIAPDSMVRIEEVAMYNLEKYLKEKLHLTDEQIKEYLTYKLCQSRKDTELSENISVLMANILVLFPSALLFDQCQQMAPEFAKYPAIIGCASGIVTIYSFFKVILHRNYYKENHCVIDGMEENLSKAESAYIASFTATKKANKQYQLGLHK